MQVFGLSDGSAIVVERMEPQVDSAAVPGEGTLSLPTDTANWIGEAVAAGITFDALKEATAALVKHGWTKKPVPPTAETVTETVVGYLRSCGYADVHVTEVRRVKGQGWTLAGTAHGFAFKGRADEGGHVMHVRVK